MCWPMSFRVECSQFLSSDVHRRTIRRSSADRPACAAEASLPSSCTFFNRRFHEGFFMFGPSLVAILSYVGLFGPSESHK